MPYFKHPIKICIFEISKAGFPPPPKLRETVNQVFKSYSIISKYNKVIL